MTKARTGAALLSLSLDRDGADTLQAQLLTQLRRLILDRMIAPGSKLPSSRTLAEELSVSRVTVSAVIDQLISEGYLEGRARSGVYVEAELPDQLPEMQSGAAPHVDQVRSDIKPEKALPSAPLQPFDTSSPELTLFPYRQWARHHDQTWRRPDAALLSRIDPFGWPPLREAIADHLREWRGLPCTAEQVFITSGVVEAIGLIAAVTLNEGDEVLTEEPGYAVLNRAVHHNRLVSVPSPVDQQGFDIKTALQMTPRAKAAIVTPSRHYPLGVTMPLSRRLELIEWAVARNAYVIEDDFDSEYRFQGKPLPAMMSVSNQDRVIYVGSFSKVIFSALRLGFVVFPKSMLPKVRSALPQIDQQASLMLQPVLARFMQSGDFAIHIRRMRRLYAKRQAAVLMAIKLHAADLLIVDPVPAGMHLVAMLAPDLQSRMSDTEAVERAKSAGVTVQPLSSFFVGPPVSQGLVIGFAGFSEEHLEKGVRALAAALRV
ncbi:PLP-dependent aminotransferase family protein [Phaeobacter gallaeciensis]|uniref:MocR-like pyridoxine biosynthesis transcription factor PdxR n=1 Tax=Phaeobacter gallaeciensis TaxID=60890 RepID=UPI000BBC319E|nr:PLP-dependent aminotransferase family protein [Phaeobacter gallaeciensis]ATF20368.1 transcriptional regulator, GntR family [Phaeobacter gallaeciensis]ATF24477.1 transcriptional regulator, GntR family [Phaeobacter gallaeciensis]